MYTKNYSCIFNYQKSWKSSFKYARKAFFMYIRTESQKKIKNIFKKVKKKFPDSKKLFIFVLFKQTNIKQNGKFKI